MSTLCPIQSLLKTILVQFPHLATSRNLSTQICRIKMASLFRLGGRQILNRAIKNEKLGLLAFVRPVTLKAQPVTPPEALGHDDRNMKLGRPQSPHLTIYAPQLTSMLSITHRATGMALAGYTVLLGTGALMSSEILPAYLESVQHLHVNSFLLFSTKVILAFPAAFHFWNGIRHLLWDLGMFLSIKEVYLTGYAMLALAFVSTVALVNM